MTGAHRSLTAADPDSGHSPGTTTAQTLVPQGCRGRAVDRPSTVPGWPRLLSADQAAAYLGLSFWTFRELLNAGTVPTVRVPRPNTLRMRERRALSDTVRRLLIDRNDLDALVERWKERAHA